MPVVEGVHWHHKRTLSADYIPLEGHPYAQSLDKRFVHHVRRHYFVFADVRIFLYVFSHFLDHMGIS